MGVDIAGMLLTVDPHKLDISVAEFEDLAGEAMLLSSAIEKIGPIGFFDLGFRLTRCLMAEDDGSASFLLYAGQAYLKALEYMQAIGIVNDHVKGCHLYANKWHFTFD